MSVIKCPRCEINFIREEDGYCLICKKEMKGEMPKEDPIEYCIECGENPVVPGEELCSACLKAQMLAQENVLESEEEENDDDSKKESVEEEDLVVDEDLDDEDIPETELEAIHFEFGFDDDLEADTEEKFDGFYEEDIYDKIHHN